MYELESRNKRFGIAPYLFGALTGVVVGLAVVAGIVFSRGSNNTAGGGSTGGASYGEVSHSGGEEESISNNRRNAIVRATQVVAPAVVRPAWQALQSTLRATVSQGRRSEAFTSEWH